MIRSMIRGIVVLLISALLFLSASPCAFAQEEESVSDRKGTAPSEGPWLDEQLDDDGSAYDNPPTAVSQVRVGISYGESAVDAAYFWNPQGAGFRVGYYDEERVFHERFQTPCEFLLVTWAADEVNGLMILGGEEQAVLWLSGEEESLAFQPLAGETAYGVHRYLGGFECRKLPDGLMSVINCVDLENYVKGVVPYEMSGDWPAEALKAQAVCARTYMVYNQNAYADQGFDITDNTESQVYHGTELANPQTDAAVDETAGQLIRYKGEVCQIYYFAADGGCTEDGLYIFGADRPYLQGKRDPFEAIEDYAFRRWTRRYYGEYISERLASKGYLIGPIVSVQPEYSAMGNVVAIRYTAENGESLRLEGRECCSPLNLPSQRFAVRLDNMGRFVFSGRGLGHNCGLSQWGARAMDEVYGYTYRQIIAFYFTGAYVA